MNEVIVQAFVQRIQAGMMELEQVPEVFKDDVSNKIEEVNINA